MAVSIASLILLLLYLECAVLLVLALPLPRVIRLFVVDAIDRLHRYSASYAIVASLALVVYIDSSEASKFAARHREHVASGMTGSAYDATLTSKFRSERNLYLSGFSLVLMALLLRFGALAKQVARLEDRQDDLLRQNARLREGKRE